MTIAEIAINLGLKLGALILDAIQHHGDDEAAARAELEAIDAALDAEQARRRAVRAEARAKIDAELKDTTP